MDLVDLRTSLNKRFQMFLFKFYLFASVNDLTFSVHSPPPDGRKRAEDLFLRHVSFMCIIHEF